MSGHEHEWSKTTTDFDTTEKSELTELKILSTEGNVVMITKSNANTSLRVEPPRLTSCAECLLGSFAF